MAIIEKKFSSAVVNNIELLDGINTNVITIFDSSEVMFEEIVVAMNKALFKSPKVKSTQANVGSLKTGKFETHFPYQKISYSRPTDHIVNVNSQFPNIL